MSKRIKKLLYNHCESSIKSRLLTYKKRSKDLYLSLNSETKSSAGDKHETGRAMIQLEIEKTGKQIHDIETEFLFFSKIKTDLFLNNVVNGSLVITHENQYYLSISAEEFNYKSKTYYCISKKSPIGLVLIGKKIGDKILFNEKEIEILKIY